MSTKSIIDDLLLGNLSKAKIKTENTLYLKMKEALEDIKAQVSSGVYSDYIGSPSTSVNEKKKLDPVGKEDDDIDNDGDSDESDSYLRNRRKVVTKAINKIPKLNIDDAGVNQYGNKIIHHNKPEWLKKAQAKRKKKNESVELDEDGSNR